MFTLHLAKSDKQESLQLCWRNQRQTSRYMLTVFTSSFLLQKKVAMKKRGRRWKWWIASVIYGDTQFSSSSLYPQQSFKYCHCSRIWITFACELIICNVCCCVWRRQMSHAQRQILKLHNSFRWELWRKQIFCDRLFIHHCRHRDECANEALWSFLCNSSKDFSITSEFLSLAMNQIVGNCYVSLNRTLGFSLIYNI